MHGFNKNSKISMFIWKLQNYTLRNVVQGRKNTELVIVLFMLSALFVEFVNGFFIKPRKQITGYIFAVKLFIIWT